jgi:chitin disaccharide deacetylase
MSAPASDGIRLIVKGDDMGAGHGVNVATIEAHQHGVLTTTNVIVPGAWFPEAVRMINENPTLDVGIHLALTSEWTNVKWRPLTHVPGLVDADGYFLPTVHPRAGMPAGASIEESNWTLEQVEQELRAQLELGLRHLPQATYTWGHMMFELVDPTVESLVRALTLEYGLIPPNDMNALKRVGFPYGRDDSGEVKAANLAARLDALGPGLWLHIDHASTNDPEMQAYGHPGYESVSTDRFANFQAWTSPVVREVVDRRGIKLTNYREIDAAGAARSAAPFL